MAITLHTAPARDWLPASLPITYVFATDSAAPQVLVVRLEVSSNGVDFTSPVVAATLNVPPDTAGRYTANIAPYLEAMFTPGAPVLSGPDTSLYKRYRLLVGEYPGYLGTGTPELTTAPANALFAAVETAADGGFYPLTRPPYGVNSSLFDGVETRVNISTGQLNNQPIPYDTENPAPESCFPYPLQLYWLNRNGGWQTWVFGQKHEYSEEVGEPVTWQDELLNTHNAGYPPTLQKMSVYSGFVPLAAYNTVFGLLRSIRVYHLDNGVFREIIIPAGEFLKHKEGQRRKELNFSFTYSEPILTQRA